MIEDIQLNVRAYDCEKCGSVTDRDINASLNILHRATTVGHTGSNAWGGKYPRLKRRGFIEQHDAKELGIHPQAKASGFLPRGNKNGVQDKNQEDLPAQGKDAVYDT